MREPKDLTLDDGGASECNFAVLKFRGFIQLVLVSEDFGEDDTADITFVITRYSAAGAATGFSGFGWRAWLSP